MVMRDMHLPVTNRGSQRSTHKTTISNRQVCSAPQRILRERRTTGSDNEFAAAERA